MPDVDIIDHTSETGNTNNVENDKDLTPPLAWVTTAGREDDNADNSSYSSDYYSRGSLVPSQRSIHKSKNIKRMKKRTDYCKIREQQQWEMMTGIVQNKM